MRFLSILFSLFSMVLFAKETVLIDIPNAGQIQYEYEEGKLVRVNRLSQSGEVMYFHSYEYDADSHLISEALIGNLGKIHYSTKGQILTCLGPYGTELVEYDFEGIYRQTIDGLVRESND